MSHYLLLFISGLLYSIPCMWSEYCWPLILLFPIPLFYCLLTRPCGFKEGFFWGTVAVGTLLSGIFYSIMHMADGSFLHKIVPWIGGTLYFALYIGIWFFLTSQISKRVSGYAAVVWLVSLWLLFISFDYVCLSIFNRVEGLFLLSPLLPLAECVPLLRIMAYSTKPGLLLLFLIIPWSFVHGFITHAWHWYAAGVLSIVIWVGSCGISIQYTEGAPWLSRVGFITDLFYEVSNNHTENAALLGVAIKDKIKDIVRKQPQVELIMLPESALVQCRLSECGQTLSYLTYERLGKAVTIVAGAFTRDKKGLHNALYVIRDGKIIDCFEKRHAMILTEHIAPWWDFGFLHDLYFKTWSTITISENKRKLLPLLSEQSFIPYICSELFFNQFPDDAQPDLPVLVLCNDTWVKGAYIKRLMMLEARVKAIQWQRSILYASFLYQTYILP